MKAEVWPLVDPRRTALLIIDMVSDFSFEDGAKVGRAALPAARQIAALRKRAKQPLGRLLETIDAKTLILAGVLQVRASRGYACGGGYTFSEIFVPGSKSINRSPPGARGPSA